MKTQPHAPTLDAATDLVRRASDGVATPAAQDRLVEAVLTHNDGRVARFLTLAATARSSAYALDAPDREGRLDVWARHLHRALDESWPVGHPAYRRHDDDPRAG